MERIKVYALWLKHEYHNQIDKFLDSVFSTYEKAEARGSGAVKNYPTFYCGYEIQTFYLDN